MKKIVIHTDENGKLVLLNYKDIDETKKSSFLYGEECYKYIKNLAKNNIVDFYENRNKKDIELEYKNYVVVLNDYRNLLRKRALAPILDNIRLYNEKEELTNVKPKKVTRKNKFSKARIIATGLSVLILSGCVLGLTHKSNKKEDNEIVSSISDNLEDDFVTTMSLKVDEVSVVQTVMNEEQKAEKVSSIASIVSEIPVVALEYEDRSETEKAYTTKSYYSDLIEKYANMYGLDSKLMTALATQERGIHSGVKDSGGATGLMQVQNSVWAGEKLSAYNFETGMRETITVDEKSLSDVNYNIKVGCMIFQTAMKYMDYNPLASIQCYNMGYGNMKKILNAYSVESGKSVNSILSDITDKGWMDYRYLIKEGDREYIENVLSWLGEDINITNKKDNGTEVCFKVNSLEQTKSMH